MDLKTKAYASLAFAVVSGSFLSILLAFAKGVNIYEFFFFVYLLSVPTGLALLAYKGKLDKLRELARNRKMLFYMCITGLLTFVPIEFGILYAEHFITASLATAIFRTSPLLVLIFLPIMLRERLTKIQIIALTLGVAGLYIGITGGNVLGLLSNATFGPVMLLVLLTLGYSISLLSIRKFMFDTDVLLTVSAIVMLVFFSMLFLASGASFAPISIPDIAIIAYLGFFFNIFSFYISFQALKMVKVTEYTNAHLLSPFLTFIWASLFLGEAIEPYYIVIAGLVTAGILIQRIDTKGGSYITRKDSRLRHTTMFDVTGIFANSGEVGISNTVNNGGRILAVKFNNNHQDTVSSFVRSQGYKNVYVDSDPEITRESKFVKGMLGAGGDEFVVMKAGKMDENEYFFEELHAHIDKANESKSKLSKG